ncbi:MAG TPA: type I glyceraldehyde-3-phosphate dehydrogenase [Candidatus Saccharimonadales bacterium]|nr:type I glyceraldehyde-3-phosphate dehydrogenase [Candidatus Saccharimonadales bacterium]
MRVGINGFGRIGRLVLRAALKRNESIDFAAVNDLTDAKTLAHLLTYDSVHGPWPERFEVRDNSLCVGRHAVKVLCEPNPANLPWKDLGVDVVLECTGRFTERDKAAVHLGAGAKRVLVSAPAKGADATFVIGVNEKTFDPAKHHVVSIASCTTNCLAPVLSVMDRVFGIERGLMTTVHAYTSDQRLHDAPHKDLRRARAAALSMIPTSTGAAKAIGLVLPSLQGKMDGISIRVPIAASSVIDVTAQTAKPVSVAAINAAMKEAAEGPLRGILQYMEDPIVSQDVVGNPHSAVFDAPLTMVSGDRMAKVFAWYDNEWGFSNRMVDALLLLGRS